MIGRLSVVSCPLHWKAVFLTQRTTDHGPRTKDNPMHSRKQDFQNWSSAGGQSAATGLSFDAACLRVVDAGLWAIVFVTPLVFGGRHPWGRLLLVTLSVVVSLAWLLRQGALGQGQWTRTAASVIALAALLVVGLQVVPLPAAWIASLSPRTAEVLPLWSADAPEALRWGTWRTLSLAPEETRLALAMLVAYALLFITTVQRVRTTADVGRMLRWIGLSAILMAGFGLVQYATSNGRFFWFYDYPFGNTSSNATGSFPCRNHFAHFLCLGLAALIAWVVERSQARATATDSRRRRPMLSPQSISRETRFELALVAGLAVVVCAILLSYSRGGALAMAVVVLVVTPLYCRWRLVAASHLLGALGVAVVVVAALSWHGYEQVAERVDDFTTGSLDSLDRQGGRRKIWNANVAAIKAGWQTGAGAGSHRFIYPLYMPEAITRQFNYAENGPLQVVTECGLPGGLLLAWAVGCCGLWCGSAIPGAQHSAQRIYAGAIAAALAASLVHSLFDFVWYVPACMAVTIILAACALRLARLNRPESAKTWGEATLFRGAWIGLATLASLAGLWAVGTLIGPARAAGSWDGYLRLCIAEHDLQTQPTPADAEAAADAETAQRFIIQAMIENLEHVVALQPGNSTAHLRLAANYLRKFEEIQTRGANQMAVVQIRDAAIASRFASADELRAWMIRAFGDNSDLLYRAYHHARCALQLSPLEGEGYLLLADLCFLEGKSSPAVEALVNQALVVRPYDGDVLYQAGKQWLLSRPDEALKLWAAAFHLPGDHQREIIRLMAGRVPAVSFVQIIEPDWEQLYNVWTYYREVGSPEDWQAIEQYARGRAEHDAAQQPPELAVRTWLRLGMMQRELGLDAEAVESLNTGNAIYPNYFHIRHHLGLALMDIQQPEAAEPHLRWCLSRRPDYADVRDALKTATKVRLAKANGPLSVVRRPLPDTANY